MKKTQTRKTLNLEGVEGYFGVGDAIVEFSGMMIPGDKYGETAIKMMKPENDENGNLVNIAEIKIFIAEANRNGHRVFNGLVSCYELNRFSEVFGIENLV